MARKVKLAYRKYLIANEIERGTKSYVILHSGRRVDNVQDWAKTWKATWEEFKEKLNPWQRELVEELEDLEERQHERVFFTKAEKYVLRDIHKLGRKMGLW